MKLVFLSNGQACYLKETIGDKFIVNRIFEYEDEEAGWIEIADKNDIVVDAIFEKLPIEKISSEIKDLELKKKYLVEEINRFEENKRNLKSEIDQITKTQISQNKFIINRSELINATTLALFPKDSIMPITFNGKEKSFRGLKLSMEITILDGKERKWGYKLYYDYVNLSGDYLCEKYGILINPTQEEIDATICKRVLEFKFADYVIKRTDDKYLTPELILKKKSYLDADIISEKQKLENGIQKMQTQLAELNKEKP